MQRVIQLGLGIMTTIIFGLASAHAEAIWTTESDCGDSTQNVNHFNAGDQVFINGAGFDPSTENWFIKGQPGGASSDPNIMVAQGTVTINNVGTYDYAVTEADGETNGTSGVGITPPVGSSFCFYAYQIQGDDDGEYQVQVGSKGDNYRVGAPTTTEITKSVDNESPQNGDTVAYTLSYQFEKAGGGVDFTITDTFDPTVVNNVTVTDNGPHCSAGVVGANTITWSCSVAGGAGTIMDSVSYTADVTGTAEDNILNTACIVVTDNGSACDSLNLVIIDQPAPQLTVTKGVSTVDGGPYGPSVAVLSGTTIFYQIVIQNTGNVPLDGVTLMDDQFNLATECNQLPPTTLAISETFICRYSDIATVDKTNTTTADSAQTDPPVQDQASVTITQIGTPGLSVTKGVATSSGGLFGPSVSVVAGDMVFYQIVMTNIGNVPLTNVTLMDDVFNLAVVCSPPPPNSLAVGETFTCSYSETATADKTNTATGDSEETDPEQDSADVTVTAPPPPRPIPTLSEWGMILLLMAMGWLLVSETRKRG